MRLCTSRRSAWAIDTRAGIPEPGGAVAAILGGLDPGTQVIAYPGDAVADGVKVKARIGAEAAMTAASMQRATTHAPARILQGEPAGLARFGAA